MKDNHAPAAREGGRPRHVAAHVTRLALVLIFALGAALTWMGNRGRTAIVNWGFVAEDENGVRGADGSGFNAVYYLGDITDRAWETVLCPEAEALPADARKVLDDAMADLLAGEWERMLEGSGAEARALLDEAGDGGREALTFKLLYATFLPNTRITGEGRFAVGKTILNTPQRSRITEMAAEDLPAFRQALLACLTDEAAVLPEKVAGAVGRKTGADRQAVLLQALFVSAGSQSEAAAGLTSQLSKAFQQGAAFQQKAFRMIARREISWLWMQVVHHPREIMLLGILLMADALLLAFLMYRERCWAFSLKWIMILLIVDFLVYFLLMPMVWMLIQAFTENGSFSLGRIGSLLSNVDNRAAMRNTLIAAGATMVLGTLLAFPLAWLVGRTNLYGKKFFRSLFVLSYMVPPYVGAMAWTYLLNPTAGPVNQVLRGLFGMAPGTVGPLDIYTLPGLIWVLTTFYYPYAFITISRAMEKMDPSLEEASRISGASPVRTVLRVTLPLMTPSLIGGALLVFVSAASCYGIPSIITKGPNSGLQTVTTRIALIKDSTQGGMFDATGLSVFLMLVALLILFLSDVVLARKQYTTVSGKSTQPATVDLRKWRIPLTVLVSLFALLVIFLPFGAILSISLRSDVGKSLLAPGNLNLNAWKTAFSEGATLACLKNSLIFAVIAATVGIVIACVMSYLLQRTAIRGRGIPNFLITLGSGTPSVVIALGLIMTMNGSLGLSILGTPAVIIVAYLVKYLMMGMRTVTSSMSQIHVSLEESSQISGAGWGRTMLRVTGPLILPSIAAGWFLIFIPCFYELSMSVLLSGGATKTIGVQLFEYWTNHSQPVSSAMAFGILIMVAALNFILNKLTKGRFSI